MTDQPLEPLRKDTAAAALADFAGGAAPQLEAPDAISLAHETGVEIVARSQWSYVRNRFFRHRLAMVSLVVLIVVLGAGIFAKWIAPYSFDEIDLNNAGAPPQLAGWHLFGTDLIGRDYFSRVLYGI